MQMVVRTLVEPASRFFAVLMFARSALFAPVALCCDSVVTGSHAGKTQLNSAARSSCISKISSLRVNLIHLCLLKAVTPARPHQASEAVSF